MQNRRSRRKKKKGNNSPRENEKMNLLCEIPKKTV